MGILIDTNILIFLERGRIDLTARIEKRGEEEFFISSITASELLHGIWRAQDPAVRSRRSAFVEGILNTFPIASIDLPVARIHAQLWAELKSQGLMIGIHDSWIAATCVANGYTLITANLKEYERVPGLSVESWVSEK